MRSSRMISWAGTLAAAVIMAALPASAQVRFEAPLDQSAHQLWSVQSSPISCVLSYAFPEYGRADFTLLSGAQRQLSLELFPMIDISTDSQMRALSAPPAWKYGGEEQELGRIKLYNGFNPFFGQTVSWRILSALAKGNQVMLPFTDTKRLEGETVVPVLSPLGFIKPFDEFMRCQHGLLDYGFQDVQMAALHFVPGETTLTPEAMNTVRRQIAYIKLDEAINRIAVRTFAFERQSRDDNLELAKQRAAVLRKLYTDAGIDAAMITEEAMADRQLRSDDLTQAQRYNAARAVVELSRDPYKINRALELPVPDAGAEHVNP